MASPDIPPLLPKAGPPFRLKQPPPPLSLPPLLPIHRPPTQLAPPSGTRPSLLTVGELERFKNLLLFAKATVEGLYAGRHRSPLPGSSAEFRDFKNYVAGDSVDQLDWRAYGRTRKL